VINALHGLSQPLGTNTWITHYLFLVLYGVTLLVGKPEGKRSLGRPRRRWEDNIKMVLQEVEGGGSWGLDGVGSG
jgi:hypothetical protein